MARLELATFVGAPPEAVWDVLADLDNQKDWMVDVRTLDIVSEQKSGEGAVMKVTSELFGLPLVKDVMAITVWDPPRQMDVEHRGQFSGTGSFRIEPAENGCVFTWVEDFAPPLGPLGEAAFAVAVKPHLTRVFARSMSNVKRLAEERSAVPVPSA